MWAASARQPAIAGKVLGLRRHRRAHRLDPGRAHHPRQHNTAILALALGQGVPADAAAPGSIVALAFGDGSPTTATDSTATPTARSGWGISPLSWRPPYAIAPEAGR